MMKSCTAPYASWLPSFAPPLKAPCVCAPLQRHTKPLNDVRSALRPDLSLPHCLSAQPGFFGLNWGSKSATSPPPSTQPSKSGGDGQRNSGKKNDRAEFVLNSGLVLQTLSEELPRLPYKDLSYSIYTNDIVFKDSCVYHVSVTGKMKYISLARTMRLLILLSFRHPTVEITRISRPTSHQISVGWRFTGEKRSLLTCRWLPSCVRRPPPSAMVYDGISVYGLNQQGWVCSHTLQNIIPPPPVLLPLKRYFRTVGVNA